MKNTIVLQGETCCGKTRNAEKIKEHFKCAGITDDWSSSDQIRIGFLHLTNDHNLDFLDGNKFVEVINYDDIKKELDLK